MNAKDIVGRFIAASRKNPLDVPNFVTEDAPSELQDLLHTVLLSRDAFFAYRHLLVGELENHGLRIFSFGRTVSDDAELLQRVATEGLAILSESQRVALAVLPEELDAVREEVELAILNDTAASEWTESLAKLFDADVLGYGLDDLIAATGNLGGTSSLDTAETMEGLVEQRDSNAKQSLMSIGTPKIRSQNFGIALCEEPSSEEIYQRRVVPWLAGGDVRVGEDIKIKAFAEMFGVDSAIASQVANLGIRRGVLSPGGVEGTLRFQPSRREMESRFLVRFLLETLAACSFPRERCEELREIVRTMRRLIQDQTISAEQRLAAFVQQDLLFHTTIVEYGLGYGADLVRDCYVYINSANKLIHDSKRQRDICDDHEKMIDGIIEGVMHILFGWNEHLYGAADYTLLEGERIAFRSPEAYFEILHKLAKDNWQVSADRICQLYRQMQLGSVLVFMSRDISPREWERSSFDVDSGVGAAASMAVRNGGELVYICGHGSAENAKARKAAFSEFMNNLDGCDADMIRNRVHLFLVDMTNAPLTAGDTLGVFSYADPLLGATLTRRPFAGPGQAGAIEVCLASDEAISQVMLFAQTALEGLRGQCPGDFDRAIDQVLALEGWKRWLMAR